MYMPASFTVEDRAHVLRVMTQHPFALVVGPAGEDGAPCATHIPMVAVDSGAGLVLEGHMARANPHWRSLAGAREVLAIFGGPNAYVSPSYYDTRLSVPTWNYIAVHAYGALTLIEDRASKDALLKGLIERHEPAYAEQWRGLPDDYTGRMLDAIVGLRIQVTRVEAKFKLSQNRPLAERQRIATAFARGNPAEQQLAQWMGVLGIDG
jgi:transcriptional regulator